MPENRPEPDSGEQPKRWRRRSFLAGGVAMGASVVAGGATGFAEAGRAFADTNWVFTKGNTTLKCQDGWRICIKCASLVWSPGNTATGVCEYSTHEFGTTYNYIMPYQLTHGNRPTYSQNDWRHCAWCGVLYYSGNGTGACAARSNGAGNPLGHEPGASFNYLLMYNNEASGGTLSYQDGWAYCDACHILFYGPRTEASLCPADGGHHGPNFTWNYDALFVL
jgi:hypothetical protein